MNGTISGYLLNAVTGEIVPSSALSLIRRGVLGENLTKADKRGRFAFPSLPPGSYSLGVYDDRYAPLYRDVLLEEGETFPNLEVAMTPGAFIKGRILDEEGHPPRSCHLTLIKLGTRGERSGYISDSGDHKVSEDGHFSSPPLHPGRYSLRFSGILRKPVASSLFQSSQESMQQRIFEFLYSNAQHVNEASPFDLQIGKARATSKCVFPGQFGAPSRVR